MGYIWSNVLLASIRPAVESKTFLITSNAGPNQIAGEQCSPYNFSTSWQSNTHSGLEALSQSLRPWLNFFCTRRSCLYAGEESDTPEKMIGHMDDVFCVIA